MKEDRILRIYTDGGCAGNQSDENLGGWGAILEFGQAVKELYGSEKNRVDFGQSKKGSFRYVLSRIWLPYGQLCKRYPSLKGKRILQPFYEIRRWFNLLGEGKIKKGVGEVKEATSVSKEKSDEISVMMKGLGL